MRNRRRGQGKPSGIVVWHGKEPAALSRYILSHRRIAMPKNSRQELSTAAKIAFENLFNSDGKLNPPQPTARHLLEIKRQVTGRKTPGELTDAEAAECYRLLQADHLLKWYNRYCVTDKTSVPKRKQPKK